MTNANPIRSRRRTIQTNTVITTRLNIILGPQAEHNRIQPDGNTEFQPLFGSYAKLNNCDKWEDDIPIAAHAEYF
ncbi:hypothetical protein PtA15_3A111 [Puccinia triticina]|uniref:Uncharacterized protein n=1 Tax=Puccinia triticina TaxID=208348 RepID=A0ABY7CE58_9BASI|nr:uncharacterized protein PtA15_3A111 [Puccinia triticina]WAQ82747.1 hypothetical protein PtA15_3A111 [Puccinia triticina]